jgi:hypothetical protein
MRFGKLDGDNITEQSLKQRIVRISTFKTRVTRHEQRTVRNKSQCQHHHYHGTASSFGMHASSVSEKQVGKGRIEGVVVQRVGRRDEFGIVKHSVCANRELCRLQPLMVVLTQERS